MFLGLLKRFAPFFITFALGLFVASFFITISAPRFQFRRYRPMRQCQEMQALKYENQILRQQLEEKQLKVVDIREVRTNTEDSVPPPPPFVVKKAK